MAAIAAGGEFIVREGLKNREHNLKLTRLLSANAIAFTEQSCLSKNSKRQDKDSIVILDHHADALNDVRKYKNLG